jgi:hypothetical protein
MCVLSRHKQVSVALVAPAHYRHACRAAHHAVAPAWPHGILSTRAVLLSPHLAPRPCQHQCHTLQAAQPHQPCAPPHQELPCWGHLQRRLPRPWRHPPGLPRPPEAKQDEQPAHSVTIIAERGHGWSLQCCVSVQGEAGVQGLAGGSEHPAHGCHTVCHTVSRQGQACP